jgi:hypothetical protein
VGDRLRGRWQARTVTRTAGERKDRLGTEFGLQTAGNSQGAPANGRCIQPRVCWQEVLQGFDGQPVRDQGCPIAVQIQQPRCGVLRQQLDEQTGGRLPRMLARTAAEPRAHQRGLAEQGSEDDGLVILGAEARSAAPCGRPRGGRSSHGICLPSAASHAPPVCYALFLISVGPRRARWWCAPIPRGDCQRIPCPAASRRPFRVAPCRSEGG